MENGSYELIEQIGQIGFYGCIKLGVEVVEDQLNSMEIDSDFEIDPYYLKGIRCGVEYFTAHTLLD